MDKLNSVESVGAAVARSFSPMDILGAEGVYTVTCIGADGVEKWHEVVENTVTSEGKLYVLDKAFAGSAYTAAWYVGLWSNTYTPTGSETYAAKGATEWTSYSSPATRGTPTWAAASGTAGAGSKAFSAAVAFVMNAAGTVGGMFLNSAVSTKGDSTASAGVNALFSIGAFSGGGRTVASGDTLNVSYTIAI